MVILLRMDLVPIPVLILVPLVRDQFVMPVSMEEITEILLLITVDA